MKKRLLSTLLVLVMCLGLLPHAALAAQTGITVSFETAIYSISKETFIRTLPEPASKDECGPDEYVTVCAILKNDSGATVTLQNPCISIDGGDKLLWKDLTIEAGKSLRLHVFHANERYLTPGLHTAIVYDSDKPIYSGRFSIGRAWSEIFTSPSEAQIAARPADQRSPYLSTWLKIDRDARYDAYSVDFKSDYIPCGTYSCLFNGYLDFSSLKEQYASVESDGKINLYGGLQRGGKDKETNFILSFWDIHCTDAAGNEVIIRPVRTYPAEKTDNDSFSGEGEGAHTQLPYEWKAGRWYRMLLRCGSSPETGNTTVEQWFQDLTTGDWTHTCTYDIGVKNSSFIRNTALFTENFLNQYAGEVRSLEFANARIHTLPDGQWHEITDVYSIQHSGANPNAYGSWQAGADKNTFYMITSGVTGLPSLEHRGSTESLTIENRENGDPLDGKPLRETVRFSDVALDAYYAKPVSWAVEQGITSGTSKTMFSPNATCTQAQILTFLWRANSSPEPIGAVSGGEYYAKAVQWAREQGLVDGSFSADTPCTRAMAVTYLWKLAGSPSAKTTSFTDVPAGANYANAIAWAVEKGVTAGTSAATFSPDNVCTRGQIVTFLYRALAK